MGPWNVSQFLDNSSTGCMGAENSPKIQKRSSIRDMTARICRSSKSVTRQKLHKRSSSYWSRSDGEGDGTAIENDLECRGEKAGGKAMKVGKKVPFLRRKKNLGSR